MRIFIPKSSNLLVISSYAIKSIQALLILYLIDLNLGSVSLNKALTIYYILGLILMFDFGLPNVLARSIIKQRSFSSGGVYLGYSFKLFLASIILSLIVLLIYLASHGELKLIPVLCLLVLSRKTWSILTAVLFGFNRVFDFRKTEILLELLRLVLTVCAVFVFSQLYFIFIAEIVAFLIAVILVTPKVRSLDISLNLSDDKFRAKQFGESWRGAVLYLASYLSFNIMYNFNIDTFSLEEENKFFFNLKIFFALKTVSQLPITNVIPRVAERFNLMNSIDFVSLWKTILLSLGIFVLGILFFFSLYLLGVPFVLKYFSGSYTILIVLICLGELAHGILSNLVIGTGNIPYWWTSLFILVVQSIIAGLIDTLTVEVILVVMLSRPTILIVQSIFKINVINS